MLIQPHDFRGFSGAAEDNSGIQRLDAKPVLRGLGVLQRDAGSPFTHVSEDDAPAVHAVERFINDAISARASDAHIEPSREGGRLRFRVDGTLSQVAVIEPALFAPVVSRIKILAGMDIADRRQPQDGRFTGNTARGPIDVRVSSMPTIAGEKLALRFLDYETAIPRLSELGMSAELLARYRRMIHAPHGFIVVCGPTGTGKTTTLYASLIDRTSESESVCSIEDPVEIHLSGISQVQINPRAGVTFHSAIRAMLRQDPDVILIGEMRDSETATVAMSAALSGQLVLTTLHSPDAARAVDRLVELGVNHGSIAAGLSAVVAQRLVRRLCQACRKPGSVPASLAREFELDGNGTVFDAGGCSECRYTGYTGRVGVFELLVLDDVLRNAITARTSAVGLSCAAHRAGYRLMVFDALQKVFAGLTTFDELKRVVFVEKEA